MRDRDVEGLAQQRHHLDRPAAGPAEPVVGPVGDDDVHPVRQRHEVVLRDVLVGALERDAGEQG